MEKLLQLLPSLLLFTQKFARKGAVIAEQAPYSNAAVCPSTAACNATSKVYAEPYTALFVSFCVVKSYSQGFFL